MPRRAGLLGRGSGADRREMSAGSDCDRTILRDRFRLLAGWILKLMSSRWVWSPWLG
jgi:hypothetical protein